MGLMASPIGSRGLGVGRYFRLLWAAHSDLGDAGAGHAVDHDDIDPGPMVALQRGDVAHAVGGGAVGMAEALDGADGLAGSAEEHEAVTLHHSPFSGL